MSRLLPVFVFAALMAMTSSSFAASCTDPGSIRVVRNTRIGSYEYVIFKYISPTRLPATVPVYTVTTHTGPFIHDASGQAITVAGWHLMQVQFQGIVWTCTIKHQFTLPRIAVKDIKNVGQFEGVVTYGIGLRTPSHHYLADYTYTVDTYPLGPTYTYIVLKFH